MSSFKVSLLRNTRVDYLGTTYTELSEAIEDCRQFEDAVAVCVTDEHGNILYPANEVQVIGFSLEAFPIEMSL